jgi:hypothetical protein
VRLYGAGVTCSGNENGPGNATNLLPWSETFIKEHVFALRRWRRILVGMGHHARQLPLDGVDVCVLRPDPTTFVDRNVGGLVDRSEPYRHRLLGAKKEEPSLLHVQLGVDAVKARPIAKVLDLPC